jgi:hypothetical protein
VRRVYTLVLGVLGIALAVVGFEFGDPWPYHLGQILGCGGTIGSLWALVLQYREAAPFEYPFTESSWEPYSPEEVCLEIARSEHGKGRSPSVTVYGEDDATGGYEEVIPDVRIEPSGTVYIVAAKHTRLSGKAVIK